MSALPSKFQMFDRVCYRGSSGKNYRVGTITGMQYISPLEALAEDLRDWGWKYDVSYIYGCTPEEALDARETDNSIPESAIELCPTEIASAA